MSHAPRRKVKANTRRHRHAARLRVRREEKVAAKAAMRDGIRSSRKSARALAVFDGVDPDRTLALLREEW